MPVAGQNAYAKFQKLTPCSVAAATEPCQSDGVPEIQWLNPNAFVSVVDPNTGSCTAGETIVGGAVTAANDNPSTCQFGAGGRNNVFGPGFAWTDWFISKNFSISERVKFRFDVELYNAFNHPNFSFPGTTAGVPGIGSTLIDPFTIGSTVSPPTGLLGSFLGGDNSVRMIAFKGRLEF